MPKRSCLADDMSEFILNIENLKAVYAERQVLHGVSMSIRKADTYGLIGLNGAGKTTMIKILLGLKDELSGHVTVLGAEKDDKSVKAEISYLPERFDPPWFLTGGEFIKFSVELYGRKVDQDIMREYASSLALDPAVLSRKVQTYSKGMRQKLGLIATILTGCSILILDEPMSGLDPLARALVKNLLLKVKSEGRTIILSSHILADMDEICDNISVLHDGIIHYSGTPDGFKVQMNENSLEQAFLHIVKNTQDKIQSAA